MMPKLSIITINCNNAHGLKKTMKSVFNQTSKDFEYIVVDGNSTDGSVALIQQFNNSTIEQFTWISESDSGIYNAMNKGIRMAKGEYIQFLNSGDFLAAPDVTARMLTCLFPIPQVEGLEMRLDIFVGNSISIRPDGKVCYDKNNEKVSLMTFYRGTIPHASAYIRRALFDEYGFYDESLKITSDWKWYLMAAGLNRAKVSYVNIDVAYFDVTGISSTNNQLQKEERRKVLEELIPAPILADYDHYAFDIDQMERIKRYPVLYRMLWFIERCLFKLDKWEAKYWGWKKRKS